MTLTVAEFRPDPIHVHVGRETIEVHSLACAIDLLRSLRHDRLGRYAEMLLTQLEQAREPSQQAHAWAAFRSWAMACGLHAGDEGHSHAA
ncbi:hypothetical protein J2X65_004974 [Ancylobacter sp. 3268]|uniref:hypothetical protein n=1 Tax=Ancylobacter sp. 3268 TaxID=2817752 RepID=UPI002863CF27|nr:hypothetical protein [Ancylobacter sp. 3268]MDR6955592.1 hypothetical protein [Ancylobacter sp. 3268]